MTAKLLIALCVLACFVAADPSCSTLNNKKVLCSAQSTDCTWTDVSANNSCQSGCSLYPKVETDCTQTNGCAFTASTCAPIVDCPTATQDKCTDGNNCSYTQASCSVNTSVNMSCTNADGTCLANLPAYCTSTPTNNCAALGKPTGTCPTAQAAETSCTAPCSVSQKVTTCTSICSTLSTDDCANTTYSPYCVVADGACTTIATDTSCDTLVDTCGTQAQCVANTIYNCQTSSDSLTAFCSTTAGTACGDAQLAAWCGTVTTYSCTTNQNYCVLGADGNQCATDNTNCVNIIESCATKDANACVWSAAAPTCSTDYCTGSFATCNTASAAGCSLATSNTACTTTDDSCVFYPGGTCSAGSSGTNGLIIAFCSSLLAFVFAL